MKMEPTLGGRREQEEMVERRVVVVVQSGFEFLRRPVRHVVSPVYNTVSSCYYG
jgi:hypothetical protein